MEAVVVVVAGVAVGTTAGPEEGAVVIAITVTTRIITLPMTEGPMPMAAATATSGRAGGTDQPPPPSSVSVASSVTQPQASTGGDRGGQNGSRFGGNRP